MFRLFRRLVEAVERIAAAEHEMVLIHRAAEVNAANAHDVSKEYQRDLLATQRDVLAKADAFQAEQRRHMAECARVFHGQREAPETVN
jgi:predicted lipase